MSDNSKNRNKNKSNNGNQNDEFRPWSIIGLDQCGSESYAKSQENEEDAFQVLYEHEKQDEDDTFKRLYEIEGQKDEFSDPDNEFVPFHVNGMTKKASTRNFHGDGESPPPQEEESKSLESDESVAVDADGAQTAEKEPSSLLKTEREMAFEEGFNSGFEQGKKQGYEEGLGRGREQGYEEGREKGEQEGYDAGLEKGEQDGKMVSDAKAMELISSLEDICLKTEQAWQTMIKKHEHQILSLICKVAEKVAFAKVDLSEGVVRETVLQALTVMPEPEEIFLNISPDDYEYIEMIKDDFFERFKSLKSVSVISNPSVQRGGCKIESSKARVESDVESRLKAVVASIMAAGAA